MVGVGDDTAEVTEFADEVLEEASLVVVKTEVLVTAFDEDAAVFARLAVVLPNENTFVNDVLPDDNTPGNDVVSPRVLNVGSGPNVAVAKGLTDTGLKIAQSFAIEIIVPGLMSKASRWSFRLTIIIWLITTLSCTDIHVFKP